MKHAEGVCEAVLDALTAGVCVVSHDGRILAANSAWTACGDGSGRAGEPFLEGFMQYLSATGGSAAGEAGRFAAGFREVAEGRSPRFESEFRTGDGENAAWHLVRVTPVAGHGVAVTRQDVTDRVALERRLKRLASTDHLTGLANRRTFFERGARTLERVKAMKGRACVVLLDLDRFKEVNDLHGHAVGDAALVEAARAILGSTRQRDLAARLGGEEFAVAAWGADRDAAVALADRIREAVSARPVRAGEGEIRLTASAGVAEISPADSSIGSALARADEALYAAKRAGRDRTMAERNPVQEAA